MASAADSYYFFGDSLTAEGSNGQTAPVMWTTELRNDTSVYQGANYAIGGATTGSGDSSYLGQVNAFLSSNPTITSDTVAAIWIGTNNVQIGASQNQPASAIASTSINDIRTGVEQLASAGVTNVVILGVYDISLTNALGPATAASAEVRSDAAAASQQLNAQIQSLTVPGVTIVYFDMAAFINHLQMNPAKYGFTQIMPLPPGATCDATCQQTSIFSDEIHFSAKTQALIGDYVASGNPAYNNTFSSYGVIYDNVANSNSSIQVSAPLARAAAVGFAASLFDRLDALRQQSARSAFAQAGKRFVEPPSRWSAFVMGDVSGGRLLDTSISQNQSNLNFTTTGQTAGLQYNLRPDALIGIAINHTFTTSSLDSVGQTSTDAQTYQAALFGSLGDTTRFIDGSLIAATQEIDQTRSGSFGELKSTQTARTFAASTRGGALMPVGSFRAGPIGGLSFSRTWVDGYEEGGGTMYAMGVQSQTSDSLVGQIGVQFRTGTAWPFDLYMNIVYEREFLDPGPSITSYLVGLPTQQFQNSPAVTDPDIFKLTIGGSYFLSESMTANLSAYGLMGAQGSYAAGVSAGLKHNF